MNETNESFKIVRVSFAFDFLFWVIFAKSPYYISKIMTKFFFFKEFFLMVDVGAISYFHVKNLTKDMNNYNENFTCQQLSDVMS